MSEKNIRRSKTKQILPVHEIGKVPPQAVELESTLLSRLINFPDQLKKYAGIIFPEMFYKDSNKLICGILLQLLDKGIVPDSMTISEEAKKNKELDLIGGPYYITSITSMSSGLSSTHYYIRILHQYWMKRNTIYLSQIAIKDSYQETEDIFDIVDNLNEGLDDMMKKVLVGTTTNIKDTKNITLAKINAALSTMGHNYYNCGLKMFDNIVKMSGNNVILLAAKNGSGKTKFIIYLMMQYFTYYFDKVGALWYSMEDPDDKIMRNMIANKVKLTDDQQMSKGYKLSQEQLEMITYTANDVSKYDIEFVNEQSSIRDIGKNYRKFRKSRKDKKLNFLIIDNLMLLKENGEFRNQTEADVAICKEIDSWNVKTDRQGDPVVILVHHFNDEQIKSTNLKNAFRPSEGHVKGNARYRDIATMIWLLNRPGQFPALISQYPGKEDILKNILLLDIVKNRNSITGLVRMFIDLGYNIIEEF